MSASPIAPSPARAPTARPGAPRSCRSTAWPAARAPRRRRAAPARAAALRRRWRRRACDGRRAGRSPPRTRPTTRAGPARTPAATSADAWRSRRRRRARCRRHAPGPWSTASRSRPRRRAAWRGGLAGALDVPGDEVLELFLAPAHGRRLTGVERPPVEVGQAVLTGKQLLAVGRVPSGVPVVAERVELARLDDRRRRQQRSRHRVHPADVGVEQIVTGDRLATQLGVEVEAAGGEPATPQDLEHAERHLLDADREAVDVP